MRDEQPGEVVPRRYLHWSVVLSMLTGAALTAALIVTFAPPLSGEEKLLLRYRAEQERVWGHKRRETPETIVTCAGQLTKIHHALEAYDREHGHPLVETEKTTLLPAELAHYLSDKGTLICPADPTKGTHNGTREHPTSYSYLYSRYWLERNGGKYINLAPDTPTIICDHHPGAALVLRWNGMVEVAPKGKYPQGFSIEFTRVDGRTAADELIRDGERKR